MALGVTLSREDRTDLLLITLVVASIAAFVRITIDLCKPLPLRRRIMVSTKRALHL